MHGLRSVLVPKSPVPRQRDIRGIAVYPPWPTTVHYGAGVFFFFARRRAKKNVYNVRERIAREEN